MLKRSPLSVVGAMTSRYRDAWSYLVVLVLIAGACDDEHTASSRPWHDVRDSVATYVLEDSPSLCSDCIRLERLVTLGDTAGPGYVEVTKAATMDSLGRLWIGQEEFIKVFSPDGRYLRQVGRKGKGPTEFQLAWPVYTDGAGRVHIIDPGNSTESVFDSDFVLLREQRLQPFDFRNPVSLGDDSTLAVSGWLTSVDGLGQPVHVLRGGGVVHSFGNVDSLKATNPFMMERLLAADDEGHVFTATRFEYNIVAWTESGRRVVGYSGPKLNEGPVRWAPYDAEDNPIPNELVSLRVKGGRLWVVSWRVQKDWRDKVEERVYPNGLVGLRNKPGITYDSLLSTRIEVIDLKKRRIVARIDRPELFTGFIGDGVLFQSLESDDGTPFVAVWSVVLRER